MICIALRKKHRIAAVVVVVVVAVDDDDVDCRWLTIAYCCSVDHFYDLDSNFCRLCRNQMYCAWTDGYATGIGPNSEISMWEEFAYFAYF